MVENAVKGPRTQGQRLLLAQAALHATTTGESAHNAIELTERAWDGGRMLAQANPQWIGWRLVAASFLLNGELESALEVAQAALEDARRRAWPLAFATASYVRGLPQLWQGRVDRRARRPRARRATPAATAGSSSRARPPRTMRCA